QLQLRVREAGEGATGAGRLQFLGTIDLRHLQLPQYLVIAAGVALLEDDDLHLIPAVRGAYGGKQGDQGEEQNAMKSARSHGWGLDSRCAYYTGCARR